ncbi:MAG TPA: type II toxin-antitoxin system antitoxin SocA domain-containing protein [Candidatus Saccharimonadales bacterium]|jgi:transcriptional regulator with XRE-family HTH domain
MNNLGKNLEQARSARGYTLEQVAKVANLSRQTYALVEAGKRDITISKAEALAAMLRVTIDDLRGAPDGVSTLTDSQSSLEKYKQMILNAMQFGANETDGKVTKTKLAKLVYLADFTWYYDHLMPMSGMSYRKLPRGPVPDIYFRALDELEEDGAITREEKGRNILLKLAESGDAPANRLSKEERTEISKIAKSWQGKQTQEIVDFTHAQLPWQICRDGEVIPYSLITQEDPDRVYGSTKL